MKDLERYKGLMEAFIADNTVLLEPIIDLCLENDDTRRANIWTHINKARSENKPCMNQWIVERQHANGMKYAEFHECRNATSVKMHGFTRTLEYCENCLAKDGKNIGPLQRLLELLIGDDNYEHLFGGITPEEFKNNTELKAIVSAMTMLECKEQYPLSLRSHILDVPVRYFPDSRTVHGLLSRFHINDIPYTAPTGIIVHGTS